MMKQVLLTIGAIVLAAMTLQAQVQTPAPSPSVKMEQAVGMSTVTLEYSRPGVKGRTVFGDLVPFDKIWRTGANRATKVTFSKDINFNGKEVKAGTYAMYTIPGKDSWTVMLNTDLSIGGNVAKYSTDTEVHRSTVKPNMMDTKMESFMIFVDNLRDASADLVLAWDQTAVVIPMKIDTDKDVMASIERTMAGPSANDFYASALYYYNNDKDMDQALKWISKAADMRPEAYWVATWKARILDKMDKRDEAVSTAKKAMEMAEKAGNMDYVKINKGIIKGGK
ncbi:MAG: DUF2911 domain-containing protein [Bacteroidota bacterium]